MFGSAANSSNNSLEIKAGRMNLVDSEQGGIKKKMIHPDNRWVQRMIVQKSRHKT